LQKLAKTQLITLMDLKLREVTPDDPSMVEALGWIGRNLSLGAFAVMEVFGDLTADGELVKKGVGFLAIAGICETLRVTEKLSRQREASEQ
jgi:hypothetical protein